MPTVDEVYQDVMVLLKQGFSMDEISTETGWPIDLIRQCKRRAGFKGRVIDPLAGIDTDALIESYRAGTKILTLCEEFEISHSKLYRILAMLDEPTRTGTPIEQSARKRAYDEAVQMYKDGFKIWEIEMQTGVSQPTIHKEVHRRGVPLRRGSGGKKGG